MQLTSPPSAVRALEAPHVALPEELWGGGGWQEAAGARPSTQSQSPARKRGLLIAPDTSPPRGSFGTAAAPPGVPDTRPLVPGRGTALARSRRIHVVAGEAVRVLDDPLLVDVHEDLLAADGADAVGEVLGGHPRGAVELSRAEQRERWSRGVTRPTPPRHS